MSSKTLLVITALCEGFPVHRQAALAVLYFLTRYTNSSNVGTEMRHIPVVIWQ